MHLSQTTRYDPRPRTRYLARDMTSVVHPSSLPLVSHRWRYHVPCSWVSHRSTAAFVGDLRQESVEQEYRSTGNGRHAIGKMS